MRPDRSRPPKAAAGSATERSPSADAIACDRVDRCGANDGRRPVTDGGSEDGSDDTVAVGSDRDTRAERRVPDGDVTDALDPARDVTEIFDPEDAETDRDATVPLGSTADDASGRDASDGEGTETAYDRGRRGPVDPEEASPVRWLESTDVRTGIVVNVLIGTALLVGGSIHLGRSSFLALVTVVGLLFSLAVFTLLRFE